MRKLITPIAMVASSDPSLGNEERAVHVWVLSHQLLTPDS